MTTFLQTIALSLALTMSMAIAMAHLSQAQAFPRDFGGFGSLSGTDLGSGR